MRGSRVQAVVNELQGEKIDIIPWSPDAATFIVNALQPAEVVKVVLDEDSNRIEVVVPDDQLSLAIGRRGQNVRLASQLTGWDIDILTEPRNPSAARRSSTSARKPSWNRSTSTRWSAQLLASEGFRSVEELAYVEPAELASIEGFDDDTATEIQQRARDYPRQDRGGARCQARRARRRRRAEGDRRRHAPMLVKFGENDVKSVEDLAGCATDDLVGWTERKGTETSKHAGFLDGLEVSREDAEMMIMRARLAAGWIDALPEPAAEEGRPRSRRRGADCWSTRPEAVSARSETKALGTGRG